jgi:protein gp37
MSETTGIAWTDATFNIAWGCTKVSPGCKHCYAEGEAARFGHDVWGPTAPRRIFNEKHWKDPERWARKWYATNDEGRAMRIFTSSMADVFEDHPQINAERPKLWKLIRSMPHVDWQVLTKRPENFARFLPDDWGAGYKNVWLGVSAEDQKHADLRIPVLLKTPAALRWVSYEPALDLIDFAGVAMLHGGLENVLRGETSALAKELGIQRLNCIDWIVVGGESGHHARPFDVGWARFIVQQCARNGVACFVKQLGARPREVNDAEGLEWPRAPGDEAERERAGPEPHGRGQWWTVPLRDRKGGDLDEWPEDLRVRQFPTRRAP